MKYRVTLMEMLAAWAHVNPRLTSGDGHIKIQPEFVKRPGTGGFFRETIMDVEFDITIT